MKTLKSLGFQKNWTYETIVTCYSDTLTPHVSTFGLISPDLKKIVLEIYEGSKSLSFILNKKDFVINLLSDPIIFYQALYDKENLRFIKPENVNAPVLANAETYIEARLQKTQEKEHRQTIHAEIVNIHSSKKPVLINRADHLLLESIITATRIHYLPEGKPEETLKDNYRVINKVAPGSPCIGIMKRLIEKCGFEVT